MTPHDKTDEFPSNPGVAIATRARPHPGARHALFLGVAAACVMGVGLGLWARPAMTERRAAARPADTPVRPEPITHRLQIVVDDRPAPIGVPLDVRPATSDQPANVAPRAPAPEPATAPLLGAWQGLIKARNVAPPAQPAVAPVAKAAPPVPAPRKLAPLVVAARLAPKPVTLKTRPSAPAAAHLARAEPDRMALAKAHRLDLARAAAAKTAAHKAELALAAKTAKTARQRQVELAKAEAKGRAEAKAEARTLALAEAREDAHKRTRLLALAHAVQKLLPHQTAPAPVHLARADRRHTVKSRREPRVEQASMKVPKTRARAAPPTYRTHAPQPAPQHSSGLMKVSDPGLGAAERQLNRAYQDARAAGVPDAQLQRQQQRWLAARSAAAREAPWAVHDVYLARIAELNGQAREARPDGY
jgi:hypothetical protein